MDKSNVLRSFGLFRRVFQEVGESYPTVEKDFLYADAAAQALVQTPQRFDVLVMENFLGDILSDLGGGTVGGIGMCPSGNIGEKAAYFGAGGTARRPTSRGGTSRIRARRSSPRRCCSTTSAKPGQRA